MERGTGLVRVGLGLVSAAAAVLLAARCGGGDEPAEPATAAVSTVGILPTSAALFVTDTLRLFGQALDQSGKIIPRVPVTWESSDRAVATIDSQGLVRAVAPGTTVITALLAGKTARLELPVSPAAAVDNVRVPSLGFAFQEEPHLVLDRQGRLFLAWKEATRRIMSEAIAFARSDDGGRRWTQLILMPLPPNEVAADPWLALDASGGLHYVWMQTTPSATGNTQGSVWRAAVSSSSDAGATWTPSRLVDAGGGMDKPSIHADRRGGLYVAYVEVLSGSLAQVHLAISRNNGASWETPSRVTEGRSAQSPVLASADNKLYLAWWSPADANIYFRASDDAGRAWRAEQRLNPQAGSVPFIFDLETPTIGFQSRPPFPSIAVHPNGRISVAWPNRTGTVDQGDWDVLIRHSDDGGISWSAPERVNDVSLDHQWMITLATGADGTLHAIWYDGRTGNTNLAYARLERGSNAWSKSFRITTAPTPGTLWRLRLGDYLGLAADEGGTAYAAWTDWRGESRAIYVARIPAEALLAGPRDRGDGSQR